MPSFEELQLRLARHLRDPARVPAPTDLEDRRVGIYRELLFNNVRGLLAGNFPVIRRLLGDLPFSALVREFYRRHAARTPLFHELGSEFVRFLGEHPELWQAEHPFLHELAHYEWVELALDLDPASFDDVRVDATLSDPLESVPVPSGLAWLLGYRFPVHRIRPGCQPGEAPAQPSWIVVYRNRADRVQFQSLEPLAARLLALVQEDGGNCGRALVEQVASEAGQAAEPLLAPADVLLRGWIAREVLAGLRA
ncbi:MAG: putative DNA-binding domain-containing protein [Xanthomonadales bacterium]|nr:hypothetical protein [Xanthomonadales bacterium]MCC6593204.1 putative DNA-binding domain-containing protein [Xanthomonadales bacterium]MCE7930696.1 DUF2063 domain-containing protein [Xanthomonadales bacterium PRO6]